MLLQPCVTFGGVRNDGDVGVIAFVAAAAVSDGGEWNTHDYFFFKRSCMASFNSGPNSRALHADLVKPHAFSSFGGSTSMKNESSWCNLLKTTNCPAGSTT